MVSMDSPHSGHITLFSGMFVPPPRKRKRLPVRRGNWREGWSCSSDPGGSESYLSKERPQERRNGMDSCRQICEAHRIRKIIKGQCLTTMKRSSNTNFFGILFTSTEDGILTLLAHPGNQELLLGKLAVKPMASIGLLYKFFIKYSTYPIKLPLPIREFHHFHLYLTLFHSVKS